MKKRVLFLVLLALALSLCAPSALSETHWERDPHEHWLLDEKGMRTEVGAHQMNDDVCEVCQSSIWLFDDGACDITNYNDQEEIIRGSFYDADGTLTDDYLYIYSYSDSGVKLASFTYYFGILIEEIEYGVDPFGYSIVKKITGYNDDGGQSITLCDEYGNVVSTKITDANEKIIFEETYEYIYEADGFPAHTVHVSRFEDGSVFKSESDKMGNLLCETQLAPDGSIVFDYTFAYEYDEFGRMLRGITLENGRAVFESYYAYSEDDFWGYQIKTIDYFEDGSKTVCELDEFGEIVSETSFNSDGEVIS